MATSDPPLSVLMLSARFQPRGSSAYTLRLIRRLPDLGVKVSILCPDASQIPAPHPANISLREHARLDRPVIWRLLFRFLLPLLKKSPPDLIHTQSRRMLPQGNWLAKRLKRPQVLSVHDHLRPGEPLRFDPQCCTRILCVSESVKTDLLQKTRLPESLLEVIPAGVDVPEGITVVPPLQVGHVPVIGTAGPLEAVKGIPFFLGAAQRVLLTGRDVEFLVAGAGPEEANLRRLARSLGISERVTFVPYVLDFAESLAAMDLFVLPSLQQGLGTVMLEAMSLGRAVIATGVGGVYSIVRDRQTGLIVPTSERASLDARMMELLDIPARAQ